MHHIMKYSSHCALVSYTYIFHPRRHHGVIKITYGGSEGSFLHIFWHHSNLVVPTEPINEGKHGISYSRVYQQVHVGQREFIFGADPIKVPEVHTASYLPIFLLHWYNVG